MRLIRVMCTGRVDLAFVLRAFSKRADGVIIMGCHLNECNYITEGNFYALSMTDLAKRLLENIGLNSDRLRIELISGGEGGRFADIMNEFANKIEDLGHIGSAEGLDEGKLKEGFDRITRLIPHIKIEKRDKLELRLKSKQEYENLFTRDEIEKLLGNLVSYYINPAKCQACMMCAKKCPVTAIDGGKNLIHVIDQEKCIKCGMCFEACPPRFGAVEKIPGEQVPPPIDAADRKIDRRKNKQ